MFMSQFIWFILEIDEVIGDKWTTYEASDVQLEFRRIDPYVRLYMNLTQDSNHHITFKLPDVYGVFQFIVDYSRIGFNSIYSSTQVSVRPLQHVEYERFILCAFPYYFSSLSMMMGFLLFSVIYLNHAPLLKTKLS